MICGADNDTPPIKTSTQCLERVVKMLPTAEAHGSIGEMPNSP